MKKIIGIIGGGNMGEALIKGLYKSNTIYVCEINAKRTEYLRKRYKVKIVDIHTAIKNAKIIILAVKPQDMHAALSWIRSYPYTKESRVFISIAAGLTTKFFESNLKSRLYPKPRIIRSMPNLPALINDGITGICAGEYATTVNLKTAKEVLSSIGQTIIVKESMMDAVTAVSGSGPAYVFLFVEQWIKAAEQLGFDKMQSRELVYKTLLGSSHLLNQSEFDASELRIKVTSKGGTTQAAMDVFFKRKFDKLMKEALVAAEKRAKELAK